MPQLAQYKYRHTQSALLGVIGRLQAMAGSIRARALHLFARPKSLSASPPEDWLETVLDVVWSPASEWVYDEKEFRARIAVPGFEAKDIKVSTLPAALVIHAESPHHHEGKHPRDCFSAFSGKRLVRHLDLPRSVDINRVRASVDNGVLQITAPMVLNP
jgi:HSP20 family protein